MEIPNDKVLIKIIKVGPNSGAIIIPKSLLRSKHLKPGDFIQLSLLGLGSLITRKKIIVVDDTEEEVKKQ